MGFEKRLNIKAAILPLNGIFYSYFKTLQTLEILSTKKNDNGDVNEFLLRYIDAPLRDKWAEDIVINWTDDEMYICFYSGNIKMQDQIYDGIKSVLNENEILFEEMED